MANYENNGENQQKALMHPFSEVKKIVAIVGGKGGVGKSSICAMLAVAMQRRGYSVGILDADLTGPSIPKAFGLTEEARGDADGVYPVLSKFGLQIMSMNLLLEDPTDPVVWRGPVLSEYVKSFYSKVVWSGLDFLFIDMPPGTGDIALTVLSSFNLDGAVVVLTPTELSELIAQKATNMAKDIGVPILGAVQNRSYFVCDDCGEKLYPFGKGHIDEFCEKNSIDLSCIVPIFSDIAKQTDRGLIELYEGDFLEKFCDGLEKKLFGDK